MTEANLALLLAASFTLGCIAIHAFRRNAKAITPILTIAAISIGAFTVLVMMAERPKPISHVVAYTTKAERPR